MCHIIIQLSDRTWKKYSQIFFLLFSLSWDFCKVFEYLLFLYSPFICGLHKKAALLPIPHFPHILFLLFAICIREAERDEEGRGDRDHVHFVLLKKLSTALSFIHSFSYSPMPHCACVCVCVRVCVSVCVSLTLCKLVSLFAVAFVWPHCVFMRLMNKAEQKLLYGIQLACFGPL